MTFTTVEIAFVNVSFKIKKITIMQFPKPIKR